MRKLLILFALLYSATSFAQLSPPAQDTFPWFVNYRLPTRVVGTKAPSSIFVMDSTQTKLRAIPTDSITSYIPRHEILGYKEYVALLSQSDTDAPVATVLYNDIGAIVWTRNQAGLYQGTLAGAFVLNKTTPAINELVLYEDIFEVADGNIVRYSRGSADVINITNVLIADQTPLDYLEEIIVTIRVYN